MILDPFLFVLIRVHSRVTAFSRLYFALLEVERVVPNALAWACFIRTAVEARPLITRIHANFRSQNLQSAEAKIASSFGE
jgi:hypothetical protein